MHPSAVFHAKNTLFSLPAAPAGHKPLR